MEEYRDRLFQAYNKWNLHLDYGVSPEALLETLENILHSVTNREERRYKTGQVARKLAEISSPDFLLDFFKRFGKNPLYMDFLYEIGQEMVVKGLPCTTDNDFRAFYDWNRYSQHPLAALPLYQTSLEPHLGGSHLHSEFSGSLQGPLKSYPNHSVGTPEEIKQITTVMLFWATCTEARVFAFDRPVTAVDLAGSLLLAVDLECLADTPLTGISVETADATAALDHLYGCSASATYFHEFGAGTNRLKAWESLAAMVGYHGSALPAPELIALAEQTTWLMFVAENKWFEGYWMDFGLAALRPGGRELAVLAGSDSD